MSGLIKIGHSRIVEMNDKARLEADIVINEEQKTVFFEVPLSYKNSLTVKRADPFLVVFLNYAMKSEKTIICEDPVSEKLLYGIRHVYIPTLTHASAEFSSCEINAVTECIYPVQKKPAVGTGMSFGCDSLYTLSQNGCGSEYPVEYLCDFNNGVFCEKEDEWFCRHSALVDEFAGKLGLKHLPVNTNIQHMLCERFLDVYSQRNMACVLALQGLLSVYLYASGHDEENTCVDPNNSAFYDVLSVDCFSTETLQFFLSGCESTRVEKLKALCDYPPAFGLLHPCFKNRTDQQNCGRCKKDIRDMMTLYALGQWENFRSVYDWDGFERRIPMNLAFLIAMSEEHLYKEALDCWIEAGLKVPEQSFAYARILKKVLQKEGIDDGVF